MRPSSETAIIVNVGVEHGQKEKESVVVYLGATLAVALGRPQGPPLRVSVHQHDEGNES